MARPQIDDFSEDEIARRRDAALLRALSTPHKKQSEMKVGKSKPKGAADANTSKRPARSA